MHTLQGCASVRLRHVQHTCTFMYQYVSIQSAGHSNLTLLTDNTNKHKYLLYLKSISQLLIIKSKVNQIKRIIIILKTMDTGDNALIHDTDPKEPAQFKPEELKQMASILDVWCKTCDGVLGSLERQLTKLQ